jgi:UDP-glucose 4-epimerase
MTDTTQMKTDGGKDDREIDTPKIAVTGAAGYIGSRVVAEFQDAYPEWEIAAVDSQYRGQVD